VPGELADVPHTVGHLHRTTRLSIDCSSGKLNQDIAKIGSAKPLTTCRCSVRSVYIGRLGKPLALETPASVPLQSLSSSPLCSLLHVACGHAKAVKGWPPSSIFSLRKRRACGSRIRYPSPSSVSLTGTFVEHLLEVFVHKTYEAWLHQSHSLVALWTCLRMADLV
jgi:hypothetical protein